MIQIWKQQDKNKPMEVPDSPMIITEVGSVDIDETYKQLIGKAVVKFPRGTVIRKTVTAYNVEDVAADKKLDASIEDNGVLVETRTSSSLATTSSFDVGDRIRIYLGYTDDPKIADLAKVSSSKKNVFNDAASRDEYKKHLTKMFDGYITKVSVDTPIELECENLAHFLKTINCPKVTMTSKATVNDLLSDTGKYKLLKGTGLTLHPKTKQTVYDLGKIELHPDLMVADMLMEWEKFGLHSFVTELNGEPYLAVGRSYFTNQTKDSILDMSEAPKDPVEILFNYNVAENGLRLKSTDKKYLAIDATGVDKDDKFIKVSIIRNPHYNENDGGNKEKYRVVNDVTLSKKAIKLGATPLNKAKDKVDLKKYERRPYMARKHPISIDELVEEAIKCFENYNMNGIEGTLVLFGDLKLKTATKVRLVDERYPNKNGDYLVEEVKTSFGTGGFRQTISMPYCINRHKQENKK